MNLKDPQICANEIIERLELWFTNYLYETI